MLRLKVFFLRKKEEKVDGLKVPRYLISEPTRLDRLLSERENVGVMIKYLAGCIHRPSVYDRFVNKPVCQGKWIARRNIVSCCMTCAVPPVYLPHPSHHPRQSEHTRTDGEECCMSVQSETARARTCWCLRRVVVVVHAWMALFSVHIYVVDVLWMCEVYTCEHAEKRWTFPVINISSLEAAVAQWCLSLLSMW